jgi:hypothetical protein
MTEKPAKPSRPVLKGATASRPAKPGETLTVSRSRATRRRKPSHHEIAERAYFIHLEEGVGDEVANWLRAEHELKAA